MTKKQSGDEMDSGCFYGAKEITASQQTPSAKGGKWKIHRLDRVSCGEGQTESRACVLPTEQKVSFRVEASARTMMKESL